MVGWPENWGRDAQGDPWWGRVMKKDVSNAFCPRRIDTTHPISRDLVTRVDVDRTGCPKFEPLVGLSITVIVQPIADFGCTRVDGGVVIVAVSLARSKSIPIFVHPDNVPTSTS